MRTDRCSRAIGALLSLTLAACGGGDLGTGTATGGPPSTPGGEQGAEPGDNHGGSQGAEQPGGKGSGGGGGGSSSQGTGSSGDGPNYGSAGDSAGAPYDPAPPEGGSSTGSEEPEEPEGGTPEPATCNTTDPVVLYVSADDSNSMAGATIARGLIAQGQLVAKAVRTYELLNYYTFDYPAAEPGHVAVSAQLRETGGSYALQVGVRAPDHDAATRRRLNAVLSVDTSSSMGWGTPGHRGIDRAREACKGLVGALEAGDAFSLVTWGGAPKTLVDNLVMTGPDDGTLGSTCDALAADGLTDFSAGLKAAYALAKEGFGTDRINRVILLSDGGANVGEADEALIVEAAKDANGEAILLMGIGVGDPWNYNDRLMNAVTDAGKGAYVFLDDGAEAWSVFGEGLLRHVEVAARDVQVAITLPPTFAVTAFHGEEISTDPEEVEPQHLAANDAMIFHQLIESCDPASLTGEELVSVKATWEDPVTREPRSNTWEASFASLLAGEATLLRKGDAVVAYAEALQETQTLKGADGASRIDEGIAAIKAALAELTSDTDLQELLASLEAYRKVFEAGQADRYPTGGTGAAPIGLGCGCTGTGDSLDAMACALDVCTPTLVSQTYTSPTGSSTASTFAAVAHYGDKTNDLESQVGGSYAVMATGPALGTTHSQDMGGHSAQDGFQKGGAAIYDAMEWKLVLRAPPGANGIRFRHVFFSQEYDDFVGSSYNDKFYAVLEAGSTNGGVPTVINVTECRDPDAYYDVVCSPGMQFCNPRQRYCYIAINTALSECCWLNGCPEGTATTDISGTGFSCAANAGADSQDSGSSTGWLVTEWPIEPGEMFTLTFHVHDTGDGIYDSAVILDGLQFVGSVTPGTWRVMTGK